MSLRTRLVLGVFVLAAAGMIAADLATYTSLRSFLVDRVDSQLDAAGGSVRDFAFRPGFGGPSGSFDPPDGPGGARPASAAIGFCVEIRKPNGAIVSALRCQSPIRNAKSSPKPKLPETISIPPASAGSDRVTYFTVHAVSGGSRYRVRASIEADSQGDQLIVAEPLTGVDSTLHQLFLIELLVTTLVLAGITALGLWVVRVGLRPLAAMEATAAAIAAGDLSRRVERSDERTEVGRLGAALNAMLGHIEGAFKAREASEQKLRRFVADASHELRTPLSAVRAYAELFGRGASDRPDDLARAMTGIGRESERMSGLVEDLLLLARLDEGRPLARESVRLDEVVAEAVETAHAVDPGRRIDLEATPATVTGDRDRLRQVVDNLLANVRAHTPAGAAVVVTVQRENGRVAVSVADSGPGLSADELEHVFERFYRADPSRARASGGAGLGLSIVAAVTEAHGGTVEATSSDGATFVVTLPAS